MRLIKPNPGECADRQTILHLKIQYGGGRPEQIESEMTVAVDNGQKGVARDILKDPSPMNIQPFIEENEAIQQYLDRNWLCDLPAQKGIEYDRMFDELAELNHQVWKLTDQAHVLKDAPDRAQAQANVRAAEVLFAITELNDRRADIVARINRLFSLSTQEKIFA